MLRLFSTLWIKTRKIKREIDNLKGDFNDEIQQRAVEYSQIFNLDQSVRYSDI